MSRTIYWLRRFNPVGWFLIWCAFAPVTNGASTELIFSQAGDLPILLTAPHGGQAVIPGAPVRTKGVVVSDTRTYELATNVARRVEQLLGKKPYLVVAKFHRRYLDVNRPENEAFQDAAARSTYLSYHQLIRSSIERIRKSFPQGALLLDLHGQSKDITTIHRGTQNGTTVMRMIQQHGNPALIGEQSILGRLAASGFTIFPPNTPPGKPAEERAFGGGFTVRTYGSHEPTGIDAIQLEFGNQLRTDPAQHAKLVEALAHAIANYYRTWLAPKTQLQAK